MCALPSSRRISPVFACDQTNRRASATVSGTTGSYAYDWDGKRMSKVVSGRTTTYSCDISASLPNVLTDRTLKCVCGRGIAHCVDTPGNVQVYHTNGLGSFCAITDSSVNVTQTYQTDGSGASTQTQECSG